MLLCLTAKFKPVRNERVTTNAALKLQSDNAVLTRHSRPCLSHVSPVMGHTRVFQYACSPLPMQSSTLGPANGVNPAKTHRVGMKSIPTPPQHPGCLSTNTAPHTSNPALNPTYSEARGNRRTYISPTQPFSSDICTIPANPRVRTGTPKHDSPWAFAIPLMITASSRMQRCCLALPAM
jgi:hypothetical protein